MLKYNDFINEKLSDKLSGFDEKSLKHQFLNGNLIINQYYRLCDEYNIDYPPSEEIHQSISNMKNYVDMLYYSIKYNFLDLVKISLSKFDENIFNKISIMSAIKDAITRNHIEIIEYLLNNGFKFNKTLLNFVRTDEIKKLIEKYD